MRNLKPWILLVVAVLLVSLCALAGAEEAVSIRPATLSTANPAPGETMTATINATGAYAYNFWLFDQYGTIVQEKTNTTDTTWSFSVTTPGIYLLRTYATNFVTEGHADTDWFAVSSHVPPVTVRDVTVSGDLTIGLPLTASAQVENALAFNYWLFSDQGVIVQEHTNTTDTSWTFAVSTPGLYLMRVYATDFVTDAHADSEWFQVKSDLPPVEVGHVELPKENYLLGETLHVEAPASGGTGVYAFNYWVFDSTGAIVMEKTNTFDTSADFPLEVEGVYLVRVFATDFLTEAYNDSNWFSAVEKVDFTYAIDDGYVTITGYFGPADADIVIPATIKGLPVQVIGDRAFDQRSDLTGTLTIPGSVTTIGLGAFSGCGGLTGTLTLPNSVTSIGGWAFAGCSGFTGDLTISSGVTEIGPGAFDGCVGFDGTLTLPWGITSIGESTFRYCSGLKGDLTVPGTVTSIGREAFLGCTGFTGSLWLYSGLTEIGDMAFYGCGGLTDALVIPNTVTSIGSGAFMQCSGMTGTLWIPDSVRTIGMNAFCECSGLTGLSMASGVTYLGEHAFGWCENMTGTLTIPGSVTYIGLGAFMDCPGFTGSLTIPSSVTTIEYGAFYGCSGLDGTLTISSGVTSIGDDAFELCNFAYYRPAADSYAEGWLRSNGFDDELDFQYTVNDGNVTVTGYKGQQTENLVIPSTLASRSVTAIGSNAFMYRTDLTGRLTLPESLTEVGYAAFYNCENLTGTLNLPASLTTVGEMAFYGCVGLTGTLTIPDSVTTIDSSAFRSCAGLTGLSLGSGLLSLGNYAFYNCPGMAGSVALPASLESIGSGVFSFTKLTTYYAQPKTYAEAWLNANGYGAADIESDFTYRSEEDTIVITGYVGEIGDGLTVPGTIGGLPVLSIGASAFRYRTDLTGELNLPASLTAIGEMAFYSCSGLTGTLTIPDGVTSVGPSAFRNCSGLTGLNLSADLETIGDYAFYNCSAMAGSAALSSSLESIGDNAFRFTRLTVYYAQPKTYAEAWLNANGYSAADIESDFTYRSEEDAVVITGYVGESGGDLTIPETIGGLPVRSIDGSAFRNRTDLTGALTIPDSVTSIGDGAFDGSRFRAFIASADSYAAQWLMENGYSLGDPESKFTYQISGKNAVITGYYGPSDANLVMPSSIDGLTVTEIRGEAFNGRYDLTGSLTIPDSVTTIGGWAFADCGNLTGSLTIPDSVTSMGPNAFAWCTSLTGTLTLSANMAAIPDSAFYRCEGLTGLIIPEGVTSIGGSAFRGCVSLAGDLTIPEGVTTIGGYTFYGCTGLTGTLTIPASVTSIGVDAFWDCPFKTYKTVAGSYAEQWLAEHPQQTPPTTPPKTGFTYTVSGGAATITGYEGTPAANLTIPSEIDGLPVTAIGMSAFASRSDVTGALTIPSSVTTIGAQAFYDCKGLTGGLTIPSGVTVIGNGAFWGCTGLSGALSLPATLTAIGENAFNECRGLTGKLTIPGSVKAIGSAAFRNCSGLTGLTLGSGVETIGAEAFQYGSGFTGTLTIPSTVKTIGDYAFWACGGFTGGLTVPEGVTSIGYAAFTDCGGMTGTLTLPASLTEIGAYAFTRCAFSGYAAPSGSYAARWLADNGFDVTEK